MSAAADRVDVRPAAPKDVPAIVTVLSHALCFKLEDNFAAKLEHAVANKIYPGESGSFSCIVAELNKKVIGAIVTITINLHQAIASGRFSYELLKNIKDDTELVFVKALAVERAHRQQGVGRELLYAGVRDLAMGSKRVGAVRTWLCAYCEADAVAALTSPAASLREFHHVCRPCSTRLRATRHLRSSWRRSASAPSVTCQTFTPRRTVALTSGTTLSRG